MVDVKRIWNRLLPLPVGTRVRIKTLRAMGGIWIVTEFQVFHGEARYVLEDGKGSTICWWTRDELVVARCSR